jgi:hypothetical protein
MNRPFIPDDRQGPLPYGFCWTLAAGQWPTSLQCRDKLPCGELLWGCPFEMKAGLLIRSQPFSLNPTGTLSRRPLAHFVSAIDSL